MSRVIEQIASVQFQVNARQANAAMQALQQAAKDLTRDMDSVNKKIADLGNVSPDNKQLLEYQQQLRGIKKDYDDVMKAQRDFVKGAKAADQLWKAAQEQNIETLSVRSIKAGISGLRKRQENLAADKSDANNMRDFRIIQQVIDESERLMKDFRADVDNTIQVIRDGGTVSVQSMRNALKAAEELRDSVEEGTGEWRDYQQQVEFMTKSLDEYNAAQRRMKGELVDSNDARREALKLTEDGERAAAKERELADAVIASTRQQINDYQQLRKFQQERIDKTEEEISTNLRLQEAEHARLAEIDKNMRSTEAEDRRSAKSYRDRSETASSSADWLDAIARNRDNEANQLRERVQNTQAEVNAINSRIEALKQSANATKKNSKAYKELQELQGQLKDKTKELNKQTKDYEKALDRATKAQERANEKQAEAVQLRAKAESFDDKVAHAGENREKVLEREAKKIRELYMQYDQLDSRLKKERAEQAATDRAMIDAGNQQAAAEGRKAQAQVATIKSISNAIKILEEQNEVIDQNSKEWQENTAIIQRLQERLNEMKVAPALQMMTERMEHVPQLSEAALQETKKFWEAMVAGAEKGSKELAIYEGNLKVIAEEERQRSRETLKASADRLMKGGFGQMTTEQLRQSIDDAKKYQLTLKSTSEEAQKLSVAITDAEEHIKRHGIEAERAARKQEEANKKAERATRDQLQAEQDLAETMRRRITVDSKSGVSNIQRLSTDALAETKKYWEAVRDGAEQGTSAYKQAALAVKLLANEEQRRKDLATSENIAAQMADLNNLSVTGLAEVKRYWQAMADGAKRGSDEAKEAEAALKRINALESERSTAALKSSADRLMKGGFGQMTTEQLRQTIEDAKKYQLTLRDTSEEAQKLSVAIVDAEEHLKRYGVEAERAARKQEEADKRAARAERDKQEAEFKAQQDQQSMMRQRLVERKSLSETALAETKKYWETVAQGAEKGSKAERTALQVTKMLTEEVKDRAKKANERKANILGDLTNYSEGEIREAIEAGKQLILTYKSGGEEAKKMGEAIAKAEEHIKNVGLDAQRTAVRQKQAIAKIREEGAEMVEKAQNGEFVTASMDELDKTIKKLKEYQALIKDPNGAGAETFNATKVQIDALSNRLNTLKGVAEKVTGTFTSADEVMTRWAEHMNAGKTASEGMAQTLDEKLAGATSSFDGDIKRNTEWLEELEEDIKKTVGDINDLEKELAELEQKHANSSRFRKITFAYRREESRIKEIRHQLDEPMTRDIEGGVLSSGAKAWLEQLKEYKQSAIEGIELAKRRKAEELGLTEQETASEEKQQQAQRLTNEQMQEGIKLLEEEYAKTDHTTEEGIKKRQQLREAIDQMNQELKESTGEWMSVADAMKLAGQAEKNTFLDNDGTGFTASAQDIQKATQALERQRDALLQTIKAKRDNKNLTKEEKAALDQEEAELQDLTNKLKALKFEQDNFNMSQAKMQELMRTPTNAVSLDELRSAIKRADGELKRMEGSLGQNNAQYKAFAEQVRNAKNMLKEMEGQAKASATAWEKAWSRLKTYVVMYMGFNAVWQKMMGTADDLMQLSDKMGEVRKTTGFTADEVGRLSDNLKRLDVRTPLVQLLEISAKAGQLGLKSEQDVMGFTEAANKLMIALPEMGAEAATEMMKVALATGEVKKIQDQLNQGIVEGSSATEVALSKIGSTIDQLRANSAAAAPQITDFVKRVGAVGAQAGISIDQIAALGATVDAVGLRVEMSATALSRMIPAIRNNAFEVAKAIGMAPNALREMFEEADGGMEAMLAIFQHIKDAGMDPDSIEKMLGIGNMQDVMKQLNQQGARAGIVFAGLSQNVDELRRNLGVAKEAYEDNIAILQEYNKMNDTAAAKWERFKNQLEEFFVGDFTQRFLGGVIDFLRLGLDFLTGNNGWSAAFRTIGVYILAIKLNIAGIFSGVKNISFSLKGIAMAIGLIDKETKKLAWGNIFTAAAAAILWVVLELKNLKSALDKASESLGKTKEEVNRSIDRFEGYWAKLKSTNEALIQAKTSHEKLSAEVDKLRKSTDGSAESTANLKKKEDELTTSEKNVTKASNDHKSAIAQMNSIYGKYLGFILTEANYSNLAAAAHDKVTAAIEREMLMKQRQAAIGEVDSNYSDNIATGYGDLNERLVQFGKLSRSEAAKAMSDMQRFMRENLKYDAGTNATVVSKAIMDQLKRNGLDVSKADANEIAGLWFDQYLKENYHLSDKVRRGLTGVERRSDVSEGWGTVYTPFATNLRGGYAETYAQREQARGAVSAVYNVDIADSEGREAAASGKLLSNLEKSAQNAKKVILDKNVDEKKRNEAYGELANALEGLDNRINELDPQKDAATINRLNSLATSLKGEGIDIKKLKQAREKIHQTLFERATFNEEDIRNLDTTNPWGGSHEASSTDWKNMTADQLVERRKQMNEFVKSIQTDSDVKTVLGEDAALKKAIEKGMSSDMRTVIEWYNTERLKIQDELHARHLTNTGDWMDPKKQKAAHKQFQNEVKAYLEELDAYYTERNQEIQTARNNEEITEAEAWRRTIKNETEWYNRRAELQKLYGEKGAEVTKEEQDAIFAIIAERTGDSTTFIQQMIGKTIQFAKEIEKTGEKGAAIVHKWRADLGLGWEKDFLKSAKSIGKQMKFIEDTLAKERPYDGITKNLQENLDKMGVLAAQYKRINDELTAQGKERKYSDAEITAQTYKEMAFYLRQAEEAWSIDIDELLRRMAEEGMVATAEEISKSELLKQAVMGQLRKTFEEVQNAVKKEASQIKKDVDILWNDDTRGPGGMSMKSAFDQAIARLGMQQDSVSRANSLIGAGVASDNVATRLAMKQIEVQMNMQKAQYDMYKVQAKQREDALKHEAAEHRRLAALAEKEHNIVERDLELLKAGNAERDAANVKKSLGLTLAEETKKEEENIANLLKLQEESQNRLYTSLREWADLLASSVREVMEASNAGNAEYYNERAKLDLTGKGGPGAGTYIIIENEGTSDAKAHYEYLDERQALERQHEIERQNAQAEAWKKLMDDLNAKMNDMITDQINAMLQNEAVDNNTTALGANTAALYALAAALGVGEGEDFTRNPDGFAVDEKGQMTSPVAPTEPSEEQKQMQGGIKWGWPTSEEEKEKMKAWDQELMDSHAEYSIEKMQEVSDAVKDMPSAVTSPYATSEDELERKKELIKADVDAQKEASKEITQTVVDNNQQQQQSTAQNNKKMEASGQSLYAHLTAACNLYGAAYQAMSNDNLNATQKFEMIGLQAAGNAAIAALTAANTENTSKTISLFPLIFGKCVEINPIAGAAIFAALTAVIGGLMGMAASKVAKGKAEIAQATGASVGAGRLATGMMTYAEGNVNELTDPSTLTPGRSYNVDGADGHTYRAKYTGKNAKTHITSGPEFHLVGEKGQEAIIDAHTTRNIRLNEPQIWQNIQTLYNGGRLSATRRRKGRGVTAFAEGNLDEFEEIESTMGDGSTGGGIGTDQMMQLQASLDRNSDVLERALTEGIKGVFNVYGKGGLVDSYDTGKKTVTRHGERY